MVKKIKNASPANFGGPEKVQSAYFAYCDEIRKGELERLKGEHEKAGTPFQVTELAGACAAKWKALSNEEQAVYQDAWKVKKAAYEEAYRAWSQTPQFEEFKKAQKAVTVDKQKLKNKTALKAAKPASMPTRPRNAYMQFGHEVREIITKELEKEGKKYSVSAAAAKQKAMYDALSEEDLAQRKEAATALHEEYKVKLLAWEETEDGLAYKEKQDKAKASLQAAKGSPARKKKKNEAGEAEAVAEEEEEDAEEEVGEEDEETKPASSADDDEE